MDRLHFVDEGTGNEADHNVDCGGGVPYWEPVFPEVDLHSLLMTHEQRSGAALTAEYPK